MNDYLSLGYRLYYWRTATQHEVDFVLYGPKGLIAIEVKRSSRVVGPKQLGGIKAFLREYQGAKTFVLYG